MLHRILRLQYRTTLPRMSSLASFSSTFTHKHNHLSISLCHRQFSSTPYVHPLSEVVLTELKTLNPYWYQEEGITYKEDGSVRLNFQLTEQTTEANLETLYDVPSKSHILKLTTEAVSGTFVLYDGSKQAWQTRLDVEGMY